MCAFVRVSVKCSGRAALSKVLILKNPLQAKCLMTPLWGALADGDGDPALLLLVSTVLTTALFDLYRWPAVATSFAAILALKATPF